jgi:methyl coenzyme M reductase gamma subunit
MEWHCTKKRILKVLRASQPHREVEDICPSLDDYDSLEDFFEDFVEEINGYLESDNVDDAKLAGYTAVLGALIEYREAKETLRRIFNCRG